MEERGNEALKDILGDFQALSTELKKSQRISCMNFFSANIRHLVAHQFEDITRLSRIKEMTNHYIFYTLKRYRIRYCQKIWFWEGIKERNFLFGFFLATEKIFVYFPLWLLSFSVASFPIHSLKASIPCERQRMTWTVEFIDQFPKSILHSLVRKCAFALEVVGCYGVNEKLRFSVWSADALMFLSFNWINEFIFMLWTLKIVCSSTMEQLNKIFDIS